MYMPNKICTLLLTGKEKRNEDKTIPPTPVQKHKKKVAALLRKPSLPAKPLAEQPRLA